MLWCQGAQNIGLFNHNRMITMHARPRQTDGQTGEHRGNSATNCSKKCIAG